MSTKKKTTKKKATRKKPTTKQRSDKHYNWGLEALEKTSAKLSDFYACEYDIEQNSDWSIDGELRINVPHGEDPDYVITTLSGEAALPKGRNWFITVGVRVKPNTYARDRTKDGAHARNYEKARGLIGVSVYYRQNNIKNFNRIINRASIIGANFEENRRLRKISQIYWRVYWHPKGLKP